MTESEIKAIVKEAVQETLIGLGMDTDDPTEVQKDMAFVREWRTSAAAVKNQILAAAVVFVLGLLGLIWASLKG